MARPVPGTPSRLQFPNRACRLRPEDGYGIAPFAADLRRCRWVRRNTRARTVPSPSGVCHSLLPLSALPNRLRRRCSSRVRVWPFPPFGVSGNAHKPLTSKGGNRSWLTPNPLLKSVSVASRLRFGRTKPKAARGTMSPSPSLQGRREMEEDAELWSQRPVGAGESGRSGPLAHLRASAGRTAGGGVLVCGRHRRAAGPVPAALRTFTSEPDTS